MSSPECDLHYFSRPGERMSPLSMATHISDLASHTSLSLLLSPFIAFHCTISFLLFSCNLCLSHYLFFSAANLLARSLFFPPLSFTHSSSPPTIFVCGTSLQQLINSCSPPPSFTLFKNCTIHTEERSSAELNAEHIKEL